MVNQTVKVYAIAQQTSLVILSICRSWISIIKFSFWDRKRKHMILKSAILIQRYKC